MVDAKLIEDFDFIESIKKGYLENFNALCESSHLPQYFENGETPLITAIKENQLIFVRYLCEQQRKDVNEYSKYSGLSPLYIAAKYGYEDIVQYLLANGAQVNIPSKAGFTPLYVATENGHLNVVRTLLKAGADPHSANVLPKFLRNGAICGAALGLCVGFISASLLSVSLLPLMLFTVLGGLVGAFAGLAVNTIRFFRNCGPCARVIGQHIEKQKKLKVPAVAQTSRRAQPTPGSRSTFSSSRRAEPGSKPTRKLSPKLSKGEA